MQLNLFHTHNIGYELAKIVFLNE